MTSPSTITNDPSYTKMIDRALRLIRGRSTAREQALAEELASYQDHRDETRLRSSIGAPADQTPADVTKVLRRPKGKDHLLVLYHDGMIIRAWLHPSGKRDPAREAAVWRCLRDHAIALREERN